MRLGLLSESLFVLVAEQGGRCLRLDGVLAEPFSALPDESARSLIANRLRAGAREVDISEATFAPPVPGVGKR